MNMANVHGGNIHYATLGQGMPLILLLPQSTGPTGIQSLIDQLAQQHTVITFEPRGTGQSSAAPDSMSIDTQAEDVIGLLDALGINQAHLICHSTGCGVGLSLAACSPKRAGKLVLTAPWTYADTHLSTMQNLRKDAARVLDPEQYARFNAALLFPPDFRRVNAAGFSRLATEAIAHPHDAALIAQRLDAILAFDARPILPAIQSDTLVITARDDQLMPPWFAVEISNNVAGAKLVKLDGGGHMLPETRAADFIETVQRFLRG